VIVASTSSVDAAAGPNAVSAGGVAGAVPWLQAAATIAAATTSGAMN
jgi:hypothetical protein